MWTGEAGAPERLAITLLRVMAAAFHNEYVSAATLSSEEGAMRKLVYAVRRFRENGPGPTTMGEHGLHRRQVGDEGIGGWNAVRRSSLVSRLQRASR